jgi:transposase
MSRNIISLQTSFPNKSNRVTLHSFSKRAYKGRNVIERCFCRPKDFRRVATRYDKLARNFLAAVHSPPSSPIGSIESEP